MTVTYVSEHLLTMYPVYTTFRAFGAETRSFHTASVATGSQTRLEQ